MMHSKKRNLLVSFWHSDKSIISFLFLLSAIFSGFTAFRIFFIQRKYILAVLATLIVCCASAIVFYLLIKKSGSTAIFAHRIRRLKSVWLSVLLASVLTFFVFCVYTLSPIGNYTVLRMDLYHQYGPLFAELYDRVAASKSLFYSWQSAGGSGFLGNFFNYLSSPFTLLIFWFGKKEVVPTAISFIVFAKCIASAGSFSYYLNKRYRDNGFTVPAFSILYAFCAYFIAYFWNVMWLDAMFILPLLFLGIERIIDHRRAKLYFVCLIFAFITNYYEAYMLCIFSIIYFLAYYASFYKLTALYVPKTHDLPRFSRLRQSRFLCAGFRFAAASVLAAACCAVVLLPIYKILNNSSATADTFPSESKFYFDIYDFIVAHLASLEPTIRSSGGDVTPNIYCGIVSVMLLPLYLMSKRFSWKEKCADLLFLIIIFFICNYNITNFILHGFHFPNDLPYRFSFVYSFALLGIAYKTFRYIRDYGYKTLVLLGGLLVFICIAAQKFEFKYADDFTIYSSIIFIIVYTLIICACVSKKLSRVMTGVVLCCAVLCEVLICDVPKFEFGVQKSDYINDYDSYQKALKNIRPGENDFYRVELNDIPTELRMSPSWYNYDGINNFSSMSQESYAAMQFKLGNFSNKINSFMYHAQTPIYNLMHDIRYVVDNNNPVKLNEKYYHYLSGSSESLTTYQSAYPSSLGFCVQRAVLKNWNTEDESNPFENQNSFLKLATGTDADFFERATLYTNGAENCSITSFENTGDGTVSYSVFSEDNPAQFNMNFTAEKTADYYLYIGSQDNFEKSVIQTENYTKTQEIGTNPYILDLGVLKEGEEVNITTHINTEHASGSNYVWVYALNDEAFDTAYKRLHDDGALRLTSFSQTEISAEVTAKEGEILYTSIPYDSGWRCTVDGTEVKPYVLNNALLALEVREGTHTVTLHYAPPGLKTGALISGVTVGLLALFFILKKVLIIIIKRATDALLIHD